MRFCARSPVDYHIIAHNTKTSAQLSKSPNSLERDSLTGFSSLSGDQLKPDTADTNVNSEQVIPWLKNSSIAIDLITVSKQKNLSV